MTYCNNPPQTSPSAHAVTHANSGNAFFRPSEPGAQVLEPLHLTRILGPPPDVYLPSLLSFFVFLCPSVCEALKLRPLPFTHPVYVASRYFQ